MKKVNPLQGIPQVPKTVTGQWLAFSHMANHYRRLLNVKPRVDTSAPKIGSAHNLAAKVSGPKKQNKQKAVAKSPMTKSSSNINISRNKNPNDTHKYNTKYSNSRTVQKATKKVDYTVREQSESDYQLVFGPSSLKSSVDALVSDSESYEEPSPHMKPMGIAEKIRLFLDNAQDTLGAPASVRKNKKPVTSVHQNGVKESRLNLERHSRCFEPAEINKASPNKCKASPQRTFNKGSQQTSIGHRKGQGEPTGDYKTTLSKRSSTIQQILEAGSRRAKKGDRARNRSLEGSANSASVGTIRGSDELMEELDLIPSKPSNKYSGAVIEAQELTKDWVNEKSGGRSSLAHNNRGNGYVHSLGKATSMSSLALGLVNNKDSSRDSAYGFSSGESRMTTRESTPEKTKNSANKKSNHKKKGALEVNGKYKSSLSTVASSVNQDTSPVNSSRFPNETLHGFTSSATDMGGRWLSEEKYVGFLTEVTNDIVNRGIYTNKGLKSLFNRHMEKNGHLEYDKMVQMLDRLRIDVGIPKDDALNQLEFGYGSIKYSTGPYFTSTGASSKSYCQPQPSKHEMRQEISSNSSAYSQQSYTDVLGGRNNHRASHAPMDDGKGSSYSASGNSQEDSSEQHQQPHANGGSNFDVSSQSSKSSFSISETEMKNTLKNIGFDSLTVMEIVDIVASDSRTLLSNRINNNEKVCKSKSNHGYLPTNLKSNCSNDNSTSKSRDKLKIMRRSRSQQSLNSF